MSESSTNTRKFPLANLILLLVSLAITLLIAEWFAARLNMGRTYTDISTNFADPHPVPMTGSPYLNITTPPRSASEWAAEYGYNEFGYRGPSPTQIEKPEGMYRILLLGDSFTVGWTEPEEDSFAALLRDRMEASEMPVEVINAGYHDGISPDSYYAYMIGEGLALEPDLVVLNLYISNDLPDMVDNVWRKTDESGAPTNLYTVRHYKDFQRGMHDPTRFWYYRVPILRESHLWTALGAWITPELKHQITTLAESEERYETVLRAFETLSEEQNFDLYVLSFDVEGFPIEGNPYSHYGAVAGEILGEQTALDLTGQFSGDEIIEGDGHWTLAGSSKYALFLYEFIEPTLRTWDMTQPGPLTEGELAPLRDLPFEGRTLCGAFLSQWGTHHILPNRYAACAALLPDQVEIACLNGEGEWNKDAVSGETVVNGFFQAEVLQAGTCGIFPTAD